MSLCYYNSNVLEYINTNLSTPSESDWTIQSTCEMKISKKHHHESTVDIKGFPQCSISNRHMIQSYKVDCKSLSWYHASLMWFRHLYILLSGSVWFILMLLPQSSKDVHFPELNLRSCCNCKYRSPLMTGHWITGQFQFYEGVFMLASRKATGIHLVPTHGVTISVPSNRRVEIFPTLC